MGAVRGVRGATTVAANEAGLILAATGELLRGLAAANSILPEDIASIHFTLTPDLNACFPAAAARALGWTQVPLLDSCEIAVPGSLPRCIRVLMHINTDKPAGAIRHLYLREARSLRPDL